VLGGELLKNIVNFALREGLLGLPLPIDGDFPIMQYADDTIIVLPAEDDQLLLFKELLNKYAGYTGLKVNYHKSSLIPINKVLIAWLWFLIVNWDLCLLITLVHPWEPPSHVLDIFLQLFIELKEGF
jgi:hypothetical protein